MNQWYQIGAEAISDAATFIHLTPHALSEDWWLAAALEYSNLRYQTRSARVYCMDLLERGQTSSADFFRYTARFDSLKADFDRWRQKWINEGSKQIIALFNHRQCMTNRANPCRAMQPYSKPPSSPVSCSAFMRLLWLSSFPEREQTSSLLSMTETEIWHTKGADMRIPYSNATVMLPQFSHHYSRSQHTSMPSFICQ